MTDRQLCTAIWIRYVIQTTSPHDQNIIVISPTYGCAADYNPEHHNTYLITLIISQHTTTSLARMFLMYAGAANRA